MRTYDERLNNIRAKADANKKAKRAIAATVVALSVFVLLIGSVILWPELLFGARYEPTMGPVLQQPSLNDAPTVNTAPTGTNEPDEPNIMETIPTSPTVPAPTEPNVTEPVSPEDVIGFHSKYVKCHSGSDYSWGPVIIRSKEELELLYKREVAQFEDWILEFDPIASVWEQINQYDDTFFEKQSLILLMTPESSGGNTLDVTELFWIGDRVSVTIDRDTSGMTCDMAYWYVFIETDQVLAKNTDVRVQYKVNGYFELSPLETISFKTQNIYYGAPDMDAKYPKVDVIVSVEELQAYLSNLEQDLSVETSGYDAAFFDQYTLLALWNPVGSSSKEYNVTQVWRMSDGGIYIHCQKNSPDVLSEDVMSWLTLIESAETISHYAKISVDYQTVTEPIYPKPDVPEEPVDVAFTAETSRAGLGQTLMVRNYEELLMLKKQLAPDSGWYRRLQQYDKGFFDDHALVFVSYYQNVTGYNYRVDSVKILPDGNIHVTIDQLVPEMVSDATSLDTIFIEIHTSVFDNAQLCVETTTMQIDSGAKTNYPLIFAIHGEAYIIGAMQDGVLVPPDQFLYNGLPLNNYYGLEESESVSSDIINLDIPITLYSFWHGEYTGNVTGMTVKGEYATGNYWIKLEIDFEISNGPLFGTYSGTTIAAKDFDFLDLSNPSYSRVYVDMDSDGDRDTVTEQYDISEGAPRRVITIEKNGVTYRIEKWDSKFANYGVRMLAVDINQDGEMELLVYEEAEGEDYEAVRIFEFDSDHYSECLYYIIHSMP